MVTILRWNGWLLMGLVACVMAGLLWGPVVAAEASEDGIRVQDGALGMGLVAAVWTQDQAWLAAAQNDDLHPFFSAVTHLGNGVAPAAAALWLYPRDPEAARDVAMSALVAGASTLALKTLIGRERPDYSMQGRFTGFTLDPGRDSMPSGHTSVAFATAAALAHHYPEYRLWFYGGATLVAFSRVNLKRHWPSDVVAGALLGYASSLEVLRHPLWTIRF